MKNLHRILMFSQISVVLLSCHSEEVKTETIESLGDQLAEAKSEIEELKSLIKEFLNK